MLPLLHDPEGVMQKKEKTKTVSREKKQKW
jgi:hypothetical protein